MLSNKVKRPMDCELLLGSWGPSAHPGNEAVAADVRAAARP